jgi:beta-galactosidase
VKRTSFNDDWRVRPKVNLFMELFGSGGQPWQTVQLPHDAMLGSERDPDGHWGTGFFPGGVWEYEKSFTASEELAGKRVLLEFEGVYRSASVWVNGVLVGHRPYGYTDFTVSIGEHLRFGADNVVKVLATSHDDARWYSGAGIYRPVHLVVGDPVHLALDDVVVTTPQVDDDGALVAVATLVENDSLTTTSTTVTTEIVDDTRDVAPLTVFPGRSEELRQRLFVARPRRWSVASPTLYTCRTRLEADGAELEAAATTFGIRTIEIDPQRGLRINGESVELRGACIHHDNGVIGAATIPRADERRVEILQEAGFNALRSAHHPMSREMLDVCDRVGMLVMDEAFDVWTESKMDDDYAQAFPDWWPADVDAMVHKDLNHPSVIMYSIGNEIPDVGTPAGAALGRAIAERIRALDPTRLVTNSINPLLACGPELFASLGVGASADGEAAPAEMGVNTMMTMMDQYLPIILQQEIVDERTAEAYAYLDVCGYNYTESRYGLDHELHPQRVIVGSETNPQKIAANWELVREHPHVIGDFTWTGWDYLGESGIGRVRYESDPPDAPGGLMAPYPWITANVGDIDITGFRRPVSHWRAIVWGVSDTPYVAVRPPEHHGEEASFRGGWSFTDAIASWSWDGFEGKPVSVEVYADADEVELLVNGESSGRAKVGASHPFVAQFETTYAAGELVAVAYRDGAETGRVALASATGTPVLDVGVDRGRIDATDRDLAFVDITLVDGDGNLHSREDRAVTVAVDGPAVLQGFGSGNPCTEETFGSPTHDTFNGRALAVIRPIGPGTITVTVSTKDADDRSVTMEAVHP